jgi:NADPH2:quinone reductase
MVMRAVICRQFGDPSTLKVEHAAPPAMREGCVRIRIEAAGVNFADTLIVQGRYQVKPDFPFIPGLEVAGTVVEVGAGVERFKPGDRVMAIPGLGGLAEEVVCPAQVVYAIDERISWADAACFPIVYGTAYGSLVWRARLEPEETVLVLGAAGGMGSAAVQVARAAGAQVIAAVGGREKARKAEAYGAHHVIDYTVEDTRQQIKLLTNGRGVDVVVDPVGGAMFDTALRCAGWEGRIVSLGFASGTIPQAPVNILLVKNVTLIGFFWGEYRQRYPERVREAYRDMLGWWRDDKIRPDVSRTFDLDDAGAALGMLSQRRTTGKIAVVT